MPTDNKVLTLRQRQREKTRELVLNAAIEVFARAGFEAASLADIAAKAGVKKALVQYHFSTKYRLWKDAAARLWSERNARLEAFYASSLEDDLHQRMRGGFTVLVTFTRENPQWLWFMFHEAAANGERGKWLIDNFIRRDYVLGQAFVIEYQRAGLMREGSALHLLHLISGALTYNLLVAPLTLQATNTDLSTEASIAEQVELLQRLLLVE